MLLKNRTKLWWTLFFIGTVFTLLLVGSRFNAERRDKSVDAAFYMSDVAALCELSGLSVDEWLLSVSDYVSYIIFEDETDEAVAQISSLGFLPAFSGNPTEGQWAFVVPDDAFDYSLAPQSSEEDFMFLAFVEDFSRTSVLAPKACAQALRSDSVKALYMFDSYRNRGTQEIENLLFRACAERGMRLLLLRPFTDADGRVLSSPENYTEVMSALSQRLQKYGITVGNGFSCMPHVLETPIVHALSYFLAAALWVLLLVQIPFLKKYENLLCIVGAVGVAGVYFALPSLCVRLMPFACATVFPCLAAACLHRSASLGSSGVFRSYLITATAVLGWSLFGGLCVASAMTQRTYLMGMSVFSGVKFSQFIPFALCIALFAPAVFRSLKADHSAKRIITLGLVGLACAVIALMIFKRSGDSAIGVFETNLRNFLEMNLYARPRTKELFFAAPLTALFIFGTKHKMPTITLCGAFCAVLNCVSLVNTFCHGTAPVTISLVRGIFGTVGGTILGLILIWVLHLISKKLKKA